MIEPGSDPTLRDVADEVATLRHAVTALGHAVAAVTAAQDAHTALLRRIAEAVEREPREGEDLHGLVGRLATELANVSDRLGRLGEEVESAVARGMQRARAGNEGRG